jgi:hypothetical protein
LTPREAVITIAAETRISNQENPDLTPGLLASYLAGRATAIRRIAAAPSAVRVGLLFVLSAGLAREYDNEYLLGEPWYAFLPLAASLGTATILFNIFYLFTARRAEMGYGRLFRAFLGLYWLTAPLAWLYAIPYERFLSELDAVKMNLLTLAFVSVMRVVLMIRTGRVLFGLSHDSSILTVLFFGDAVLLAALHVSPAPIIDIMGGIHSSSAATSFIGSTHLLLGLLSFLSLPFWFVLALIAWCVHQKPRIPALEEPAGISRAMWNLAAASLVGGLLLLPVAQPEQRLRHSVEEAFQRHDIAAGVAILAAHPKNEFPPHWDPPPRPDWREDTPKVAAVLEHALLVQAPEWVISAYSTKWRAALTSKSYVYRFQWDDTTMIDPAEAARDVRILALHSERERDALLKNHRPIWEGSLRIIPRSAPENTRLRALLGVDQDWMPTEPEYRPRRRAPSLPEDQVREDENSAVIRGMRGE